MWEQSQAEEAEQALHALSLCPASCSTEPPQPQEQLCLPPGKGQSAGLVPLGEDFLLPLSQGQTKGALRS